MGDIVDHELYVAGIRTGWTTWTPSFTNLTGGTTNTARYIQIGKLVVCELKYTLASAGVSGGVTFTLPVTASASIPVNARIGQASFVSSGTDTWEGIAVYQSNLCILQRLFADSGAAYSVKARDLASTQPFTWKSTDVITAQFAYEAS